MKKQYGSFEIGSAIDLGKKRTNGPNQDSLEILIPPSKQSLPIIILVIADGMGGYSGGANASQIVTRQFKKLFVNQQSTNFDFNKYADDAIKQAIVEMHVQAELNPQFASMGSTVVALAVEEDHVNLINVGDSRAYMIHDEKFFQINYDHSFVGEAMHAGLLTKTEAINHPKKNQLTQSVCAKTVSVKPFFNSLQFSDDDILLMCSDGLWSVVPESLIQTVITDLSPQNAAEKLIELANIYGGPDNISVIVCKRTDNSQKDSGIHKKQNTLGSSLLKKLLRI